MKDTRIALKKDTLITLSENKKIQIREEIGRGANVIVYSAIYWDNIGTAHHIRLKECYPNYVLLKRAETGVLEAFGVEEEKFRSAKEYFITSYKKNANIKNTLTLTNSTMNAVDIFTYYNTSYILMTLDEGMDYSKYQDHSLKELFLHSNSLAKLIKKYHDNGYLHLDIKPENIFILPETEEHILLFDFDSVVSIEELRENGIPYLSFSEGFSAPEQVQGRVEKLGTYSDIYSIGAIVFYKLFNRTPALEDCRIASVYSFETIRYANETYPPKLYRVLTEFFQKTLSVSCSFRWKEMEQVIFTLEKLIELSDIEGIYLKNSFRYNAGYFIGRNEELEQIYKILNENQIVFLSGIGGIGKTELAKQYAHRYQTQYDTIVFSFFEKDIKTLVCNEIELNKIYQDENESDNAYFERKMALLKQTLSPKDLIIIDNFDTDYDEDLELLFSCQCQFIVTSRMDFRDYNYSQICVEKMSDLEDVLELFHIYNDLDYTEIETAAIEQLIHLVEYHTMTVELIAKYLRNTKTSPIFLLEKLKEKEGIVNTEQTSIKQRKDKKLRSESMQDHLSILFDVFQFDVIEKEIMSSLSLFAGIRIKQELFEELCPLPHISEKLKVLIKKGWIMFQENTMNSSNKICLHQVIQDLVYTKLNPSAETCPHITEGMYHYLSKPEENYHQRSRKQNVFQIFMNRISGKTLSFARLCLYDGSLQRLEEAEQICKDYETPESFAVLQKLYRKRIKYLCQCDDMFETELSMEEHGKKQINQISDMMDKVLFYCKRASNLSYDWVGDYITFGSELDNWFNDVFGMYFDELKELDILYQKIMEMYDLATEYLPITAYSIAEKENLYQTIQRFYSDEDCFASFYRYEHYSDLEKAYFYQEILDKLRQDDNLKTSDITFIDEDGEKRIWFNEVSCMDMARKYKEEKQYEQAIIFYQKALEREEEPYEIILSNLSQLYLEMNDSNSAVSCLETILEKEKSLLNPNKHTSKTDFRYSAYICLDLIKILINEKQFSKAKQYAKELIQYKEKDCEKDDKDIYSFKDVLSAYFYLYSIEETAAEQERIWKKCIKLFEYIKNSTVSIDEDLYDFLFTYLEKEDVSGAEILSLVNRISISREDFEVKQRILNHSIEKYRGRKGFERWHILLLVKQAELLIEFPYELLEESSQKYEQAFQYLEQYQLEDEYLKSVLYRLKSQLVLSDSNTDYEQVLEWKRKCNYQMIVVEQIKTGDIESKEQVKLWEEAAGEYREIKVYEQEIDCLKKALAVMELEFDSEEKNNCNFFRKQYDLTKQFVNAYISLKNFDRAEELAEEWYDGTLLYIHSDWYSDYKDEYAEKIGQIADFFIEIEFPKKAFGVYLSAIYLKLTEDICESFIKDIYRLEIQDTLLLEVCDEITRLLTKITTKNADFLIYIKEKLLQQKGNVEQWIWTAIEPILIQITQTCQNKEIEFK